MLIQVPVIQVLSATSLVHQIDERAVAHDDLDAELISSFNTHSILHVLRHVCTIHLIALSGLRCLAIDNIHVGITRATQLDMVV
jgi:hypothetical protein